MIRHAGFLYCRVAQLVERDSHLRSHKKNRARGGMMRETRSRRKTATHPIGDAGFGDQPVKVGGSSPPTATKYCGETACAVKTKN